MAVLFSRNLIRALIISTALFCLSACGGGTKDFEGRDERTFVGSVNVEKQLSKKSSIDIGYLATAGSNSQFIGTGIQFDGNRITEGTVENDYAFHTITAHYNYTFLTVKRFGLTASPALKIGYVDLEGSVAGLNASINETLPAIGLKLGTSVNFSDRTSAVAEAALYEQPADNFYFTTGIWVKHVLRNNVGLKFGYSTHYTGNGETGASDGCNSSDAQAENCDDSGFDIQSNGLHLGLEFKR